MSEDVEQPGTAPRTLKHVELFSGLPEEALADVEGTVSWHHFQDGEEVFDRDNDTLEVYFVVKGAVRVLRSVGNDEDVTLAEVREGNCFGELAAIDGRERSARVVAVGECELASLDGQRFIDLMMRYPVIALRVMQRFARIIRSLDDRVTDLSTLSDTQRVYGELVRLAQPDPRRPNGWYIPDVPNHKEIASWAGTSREAVAKAIGELARQGVVERKSMALLIKDWSRLQLMARGIHVD